MKEVKIKLVNPELIEVKEKYIFVYGSLGSGKSTTIAHKIIKEALTHPKSRILITRKTMPSMKITVIPLFLEELDKCQIKYEFLSGDKIIKFQNKSIIYFYPMYLSGGKRSERIKSATFDYIWVEEATEFSFDDFRKLNDRLRGQVGRRQMILSFNPPKRTTNAIYKWYDLQKKYEKKHREKKVRKFHFHILDNPFLPNDYIELVELLKDYDVNKYKRFYLGEWGVESVEALIYTNWEIREMMRRPEVDYWVGGVDFGYNNPSVFLMIGIRKKSKEVFVWKELYKRELTNRQFIDLIKKNLSEWKVYYHQEKFPIFCDSAEPARIEEMRKEGLNSFSSEKDVEKGIDTLKTTKIYINTDCINTMSEIKEYEWAKDKDGNILDVPVKFNDHAMDAMRYGVYTYMTKGKREVFFGFIKEDKVVMIGGR